MMVKQMQVGQIGTNCYIFGDEKEKVCAVVDPGDNAEKICKVIRDTGMELKYILLTHGHFDHVLGVPGVALEFPNAKVYIHREEVNWEKVPQNYMQMDPIPGLQHYGEGDTLKLGSLNIEVMSTPGHSPGSVVLKVGNALFCGDTLFQGSCGRTDFPGGSYGQILGSLKRLVSLPGDYQVFPGHEGVTTLEKERRNNYFVQEALGR